MLVNSSTKQSATRQSLNNPSDNNLDQDLSSPTIHSTWHADSHSPKGNNSTSVSRQNNLVLSNDHKLNPGEIRYLEDNHSFQQLVEVTRKLLYNDYKP